MVFVSFRLFGWSTFRWFVDQTFPNAQHFHYHQPNEERSDQLHSRVKNPEGVSSSERKCRNVSSQQPPWEVFDWNRHYAKSWWCWVFREEFLRIFWNSFLPKFSKHLKKKWRRNWTKFKLFHTGKFFSKKLNLDISRTKIHCNLKFCTKNEKYISKLMAKKFWILDENFLLGEQSIFFRYSKKTLPGRKSNSISQKPQIIGTWNFTDKTNKLFTNWWRKNFEFWMKTFCSTKNRFFFRGSKKILPRKKKLNFEISKSKNSWNLKFSRKKLENYFQIDGEKKRKFGYSFALKSSKYYSKKTFCTKILVKIFFFNFFKKWYS